MKGGHSLFAPGREGIGVLELGVSLSLRRPAYSDVLSPRRASLAGVGGLLPDTAGAACERFSGSGAGQPLRRRECAPGFVEPCKCGLHGRGEGNVDLFHAQTVSVAALPRMRHGKASLTHVSAGQVAQ